MTVHLALQLRKVLPSCSGGGGDEGEERGYQKKRREIERQRTTCDSLSESWRVRGQVFMTLPGIQRWEYYGCSEQITITQTQCSVRSQESFSSSIRKRHRDVLLTFLNPSESGSLGFTSQRHTHTTQVSGKISSNFLQSSLFTIFFVVSCFGREF